MQHDTSRPSDDEIRRQMREQWGRMAGSWVERGETRGAHEESELTRHLLEMVRISPGMRVLDVACGAGDPAFALGRRVGPAGSVLGVDITEPMIAGARRYAERHGVTNVAFRLVPNERELGVQPASFDAVTCRCALMFMPDPIAATRTWREALKPGGRLAVTTWGPRERCLFFSLPAQIIGRHLDLPAHPRTIDQFRLSSPEQLSQTLTEAGYADVKTVVFSEVMTRAESPEAWWDQLTTGGGHGPGADALAQATDAQRRAIREDAIETLRALFPDGPVVITNEALAAAGSNPTAG